MISPGVTSGSLGAGFNFTVAFTIRNATSITLRPTNLEAEATNAFVTTSITSDGCTGVTISPGGSCQVRVTAIASNGQGGGDLILLVEDSNGAGGSTSRITPVVLSVLPSNQDNLTGPDGACKIIATQTFFSGNLQPTGASAAAIVANCGANNTDGNTLNYANCACNIIKANVPTGPWRAILGNSNLTRPFQNVEAAAERQLVREDGTVVATTLSQAFSGAAGAVLQNLIDLAPPPPPRDPGAFTGLLATGLVAPNDLLCVNWTNNNVANFAIQGATILTTSEWVQSGAPATCSELLPISIYCMETPS